MLKKAKLLTEVLVIRCEVGIQLLLSQRLVVFHYSVLEFMMVHKLKKDSVILKREKIMQSDIIFIMAITMRFKPCGMLGEIGGMIGILVFEIS